MAEQLTTEILSNMTLSRLYELAREHSIKNPRKYKKAELVDKILAEAKVAARSSAAGTAVAATAESGSPAPAPPVYGEDFTPPSQQADESDYIEDEPEPESFDAPDVGSRPAERGAYPSSQLSGSRSQRRQSRYEDRGRGRTDRGDQRDRAGLSAGATRDLEHSTIAKGVLEIIEDANYGFIRQRQFRFGDDDIYVSMSQIKKFGLRTGDVVEGFVRQPARAGAVSEPRQDRADQRRAVRGSHAARQLRQADADLSSPTAAAGNRCQGTQHTPDRPVLPDRTRHPGHHRRQAQGGQDDYAEEESPIPSPATIPTWN